MKQSKFNIWFEANQDNILVYNTLTKAIYIFESAVFTDLIGDNSTDLVSQEIVDDLIFLDDSIDEDVVFEHYYNAKKFDSNHLEATIAVTTNCNLKCSYCFEEGIQKYTMSRKTIDQMLSFFRNNFQLSAFTSASITLYGGEPMLEQELLLYIGQSISELCDNNGIELEMSMITNGTILNEEVLSTLVSLGLKLLQVTIDGSKQLHDLRRPFANGRGSYDTITRNLIKINNIVPELSIRISLDKSNSCKKTVQGLLGWSQVHSYV